MSEQNEGPETVRAARSFDQVSDAYARARPSYPREATAWLAEGTTDVVLELAAGTGKLTEQLVALGHQVVASDPSPQMLGQLSRKLPETPALQAPAEDIPLRAASVGLVVAAQAYHWFDIGRALPEIARVLRPGGAFAAVWNLRDERIPWVRRLGALMGTQEQNNDPTADLDGSGLFEPVRSATFRFWQPLDQQSLRDLVSSRSNVATMQQTQRDQLLRKVDALYEEYGRGADGMLLPYLTKCYRAAVRPDAAGGRERDAGVERRAHQPAGSQQEPPVGPDRLETDELLIDFR
ncbi:MAG TPA: class I SAM-dependent methyltransferase [Nocardioidaceae bacterium]|nr:class I SAM-dependent methyltransferase [Nocardioidaceae bacterium]